MCSDASKGRFRQNQNTTKGTPALSLAPPPQLGHIKLGVGCEGAVQGPDPVEILGLPAVKKSSWNGFAK